MKKRGKRGQLFGMPYAVIFSIILIVFFIIAAWIAIKYFVSPGCDCSLSDQAQEGLFKDGLQGAIDDVWNSAGSDKKFTINLPGKIEEVCFMDATTQSGTGDNASYFKTLRNSGMGNTYLYPVKCACAGFKSMTLKHININETVKKGNPTCFKNGADFWITNNRGGPVTVYEK